MCTCFKPYWHWILFCMLAAVLILKHVLWQLCLFITFVSILSVLVNFYWPLILICWSYCLGSLSMVSNGTDNSTKKPEDSVDHIERSSLSDNVIKPIDSWYYRNQNNSNMGYNSLDYPKVSHVAEELWGDDSNNFIRRNMVVLILSITYVYYILAFWHNDTIVWCCSLSIWVKFKQNVHLCHPSMSFICDNFRL